MDRRTVQEYAGWYASYIDDPQGRALIECMASRIDCNDSLFRTLNASVENTEGSDPESVIEFIRLVLNTRRPVVVRRDFYTDDPQGRALIECMEARIGGDDSLFRTLNASVENTEGSDPEDVIEFIRLVLNTRQPVVVRRDSYEWTA